VLRRGNAGSDTAADHIEGARLALAQLPRYLRRKVRWCALIPVTVFMSS
jgi:hypothetical protein